MKRLFLLAVVFALLLGGTAARADFYVITGGGPPVGTKITSVPYTINQPGFYYLGSNLTCASGNGITVISDDVTLDLMGFSLSRSGPSFDIAVSFSGAHTNVEIRNGNIRIVDPDSAGIRLGGSRHLIKDCMVINKPETAHLYGIECQGNSMIIGCMVFDSRSTGIELVGSGSLIGNISNNNLNGFRIGTRVDVLVDQNSASGNSANYVGGDAQTAWGVNAGR